MICILGSGFGLYGYLPALVEGCGQRVALPDRYRSRFFERKELARFAHSVTWHEDESVALDVAEGAVLALRPTDQEYWVRQCLGRPNLLRLLLEKPLAASPRAADSLLRELLTFKKVLRIGYTLRFEGWARELALLCRKPAGLGKISIKWQFIADHFNRDLHSWKRFTETGGGAIRFYGIQLIALLAELGYREVVYSQAFGNSNNEVEKWIARFVGPELRECEVMVDSRTEGALRFRIEAEECKVAVVDQADLFGTSSNDLDRRVPALTELCRSLWQCPTGSYDWYYETNCLWQQVEEIT
jgi:predicted dehydrogenase